MKKWILMLLLVPVGACAIDQPQISSVEQHTDTTCTSEPLTDNPGDVIQPCHMTQHEAEVGTLNYARAEGYTIILEGGAYSLTCTIGDNGVLWRCRLDIPIARVRFECNYTGPAAPYCIVISSSQ